MRKSLNINDDDDHGDDDMVTNINYNYINIILFLLSVMKADIPKEIGDWLGTIGIK